MTILTLDDIKNATFSPARFKEGYLAEEIDQFIDNVIETFQQMDKPGKGSAHKPSSSNFAASDSRTIKKLTDELARANSEKEAANQEITELRNQLSSNKTETKLSTNDVSEEINSLVMEKMTLEQRLASALSQVESTNAKLTAMEAQALDQTDSYELSAKYNSLEVQYNTLLAEKTEILNNNLNLKTQVERLKSSMSGNFVGDFEKISQLETELSISEVKFTKLSAKLDEALAENSKVTQEVMSLRKTLQQFEEEPRTGATQALIAAGMKNNQDQAEHSTSMLLLAQKLRDEYISKARVEADQILTQANAQSADIAIRARQEAEMTIVKLTAEREHLETKIAELRVFEADYRSRISKQLNSILSEMQTLAR